MTGIVKMVGKCFEIAFCKTLQKHAHLTFVTLQMLEKARLTVWRCALKIRVSLVRFQSKPPIRTVVLRCRTAVFLILGSSSLDADQNAQSFVHPLKDGHSQQNTVCSCA